MQLVEQHVIKRTDSRYTAIDQASFASKNLYNAANYEIRQAFIHQGVYLCYEEMHRLMKTHEAYKALPRKVSQQVLRLLHKNWVSFFAAIKAWKADPSPFLGRPKLPKYKDKQQGRNILIYTIQALSKPALAQGRPTEHPQRYSFHGSYGAHDFEAHSSDRPLPAHRFHADYRSIAS